MGEAYFKNTFLSVFVCVCVRNMCHLYPTLTHPGSLYNITFLCPMLSLRLSGKLTTCNMSWNCVGLKMPFCFETFSARPESSPKLPSPPKQSIQLWLIVQKLQGFTSTWKQPGGFHSLWGAPSKFWKLFPPTHISRRRRPPSADYKHSPNTSLLILFKNPWGSGERQKLRHRRRQELQAPHRKGHSMSMDPPENCYPSAFQKWCPTQQPVKQLRQVDHSGWGLQKFGEDLRTSP